MEEEKVEEAKAEEGKSEEEKAEGKQTSLAEALDKIFGFRAECTAEADKKGFAERYAECFGALKRGLAGIGMTVVDEEVGDGYFLFGYGTNSTAEFRIKEIPGWKFGIWFSPLKDEAEGKEADGEAKGDKDEGNKDVKGTLFWQVEEFIDKFKPSRSVFTEDLVFDGDLSDWEIDEYDARPLKFTRDEPSLAFCRDVMFWNYNLEYHSRASAFLCRIKAEWREKSYKRRYERLGKRHAERLLKAGMRDFRASGGTINDRGPAFSPRYEVVIAVDGLDEEDYGWQPERKLEGKPRLGREIRRFDRLTRKRSCADSDVYVVLPKDLEKSKG